MAKKTFLSLLFSFFVANFFVLNATNLENASTILTDTCEAPPPDSLRILDAGAHYVTLAWNPVDPMATYTIVVQKEGGNANTWENVDTISNITGSSITVQNLLYGSKYQFELATNCENGDPSKFKIYAGPPVGVILDLVLIGRTPVNPVSVPNCQAIAFENFNWVGFKVESAQNLGSESNFFEFGLGENGVPLIKRVVYGPKIVAASIEKVHPLNPPGMPVVELNTTTFLIRRVDGSFPITIGKVTVSYNPLANPKTVKFCKDDISWSPGYTFIPMTASIANGFQIIEGYEAFEVEKEQENDMKVISPISDYLYIDLAFERSINPEYSIQIVDLTGRLVFQEKGKVQNEQMEIFVGMLPSGIYLMTLVIEGKTKTLKIFKN
jgi:hypothetical protein